MPINNSGRRFSSFLFLFLSITILFSCATHKPELKKFNYQLELYNKFLIWQKFYNAEEMINKEKRENYDKKWENIRYTDIIVNDIKPGNENKEVTVILTRKFYSTVNPVLHSERVKQVWKYNNDKWFLEKETIIKRN